MVWLALLALIEVTDVMPHGALCCLGHASLLLPPVNVHCSHSPSPTPKDGGPWKDQPSHLPPVTVRVEAKKSNGSITFLDPNNPLLTKCRVGPTHPQIMLQFCDMYCCIIIQNALNKEKTYTD